jgi:tetratricopeptide (TPR) repeat protein
MRGRWLAIVFVALLPACSADRPAPSPASAAPETLRPVALPGLAGSEPAFQERVRARYASLNTLRERSAGTAEQAVAFGEVGKLLVASEFYEEAEPFLINAGILAPQDGRWPYYLGHALRLRNERDRAIAEFERALTLRPDDVPALVWLGALHMDRGDAERADALFTRAVAVQPASVAARSGLGRAALARGDAGRAREQLEAALKVDPTAATVRYALAMAYRQLGEAAAAEQQLRQWQAGQTSPADTLRDGQIPPADPLMEEIGGLLDTAIAFEVRGTRAMDRQDLAGAAAWFRKGLEAAPGDPALHQNLGSALFLAGDRDGAEAEFHQALRLAPGYARAHFSLAVINEARGQDDLAIAGFAAAVTQAPDMADARLSLADALRRTGRVTDALVHYRRIFEADSSASQARFGYAIGLVRLGRDADARASIEESAARFADQPGFSHALARLLAASPVEGVRDGRRGLAIVEALEKQYGATPALLETKAMALAEVGRFADAAARQRDAIGAANRQGRPDLAQRMGANLRTYESRQPCRTPWTLDDPIHHPRPAA